VRWEHSGKRPRATSGEQVKCGSIESTPFARGDTPVIFGEPYTVPAIEFRVVDESTGKPQAGRQVIFHYAWLWWEYPYPERRLGAWSSESEFTKCTTDQEGRIVLPEHKVQPRGWYDGEMLTGRKPKFDKLSVQVFVDNHIVAGEYSKSEIDDFQQEKRRAINFPVN
jgi:hypothetical protein